ncbi:protein PIN-LIKES 5-like [Chenopodium quinoa]|uniref:protein PIN-LIKES 5-like n=1 Tax=Chenopodium quinoa TaxID=63459 RepID=UPI000B785AA5|nr:protein PIN-LIKES 5-like [Chenopodium quinoa]
MQVVYVVFTPALMFASLVKTVTLTSSWVACPRANPGTWFIELMDGSLQNPDGWKTQANHPTRYEEITEYNNFIYRLKRGSGRACFRTETPSMLLLLQLGGFYIWTYTFHLVKSSSIKFKALRVVEEEAARDPNDDLEADVKAHLLNGESEGYDAESHPVSPKKESKPLWRKIIEFLHLILEELMAPPSVGILSLSSIYKHKLLQTLYGEIAIPRIGLYIQSPDRTNNNHCNNNYGIIGLIFGATTWLRGLVIGDGAPLQVIQDSLKLLGDGTIPSITLILGGNLIQGLRSSKVKPTVIIGILFVKYLLLPVIGIGVVKAADTFGFLPPDPLYRFVLMLQFVLPSAMSTMAQLYDVGQEECSVIFLWTYLFAALALTLWSTVFMWILS